MNHLTTMTSTFQRLVALAACAVVMSGWQGLARADFKGDKELLKVAALQYKANRESIRTWQGNAEWTVTATIQKEGSPTTATRKVEFAYDRLGGKSMFLAVRSGGEGEAKGFLAPGRDLWGGLGTPEGYFRVSSWAGAEGKAPHHAQGLSRPALVIGPPTKRKRGFFGEHFDPFWYMEISGLDVHRRLMDYHEHWGHADLGKINNISVSRDGNLVTFLYRRPDILQTRYVIDLAQGGNLVEYTSSESRLTSTMKRTFAQVSGSWVPKETEYKQQSDKLGESYECKVVFVENRINQALPANVFTLDKVGIKAGDFVSDTRAGTNFEFDPNTDLPEVASKPQNSSFYWVLGLCLTFLGVLAVGCFWLRWKKEPTHAQPS